jgi:hypothetical protein
MRETVSAPKRVNTPGQVLFASLIGTTIEFFDFYIYGTAAVSCFRAVFPGLRSATSTLASLATFAIAFLARPIGSALFGHFGDRIGRKTTLVAADDDGRVHRADWRAADVRNDRDCGAAVPRCAGSARAGLGGEWGGAVLLAVENAPPDKRAWCGMFPQLGAPIGFLVSGGSSSCSRRAVSDGSRLRLAAAVSGQLRAGHSRVIRAADDYRNAGVSRGRRAARAGEVPMVEVFQHHFGTLFLGILVSLTAFVIFYLMTVFVSVVGVTR